MTRLRKNLVRIIVNIVFHRLWTFFFLSCSLVQFSFISLHWWIDHFCAFSNCYNYRMDCFDFSSIASAATLNTVFCVRLNQNAQQRARTGQNSQLAHLCWGHFVVPLARPTFCLPVTARGRSKERGIVFFLAYIDSEQVIKGYSGYGPKFWWTAELNLS